MAARVLAVYAVSRLVVFVVLLDIYGAHDRISELVRIWDGAPYLWIAAHGYPPTASHNSVAVFFPLYPLVVHLFAIVLYQNYTLSALVASFLAGAGACCAVGALVAARAGQETGAHAAYLLAFAPGASFLSPAYADGIGIALCALVLLQLGRRRWLPAGMAAAFATADSSLAIPIVFAAAWAAFRSREHRALVAPLWGSSGVIAYFAYLWARVGSPLAWFDAERRGWGQHAFDPFAAIRWFVTWSGVSLVEALTTVLVLLGAWAMWRTRAPATWWVYTMLLVGSIVFDRASWLTPRFLLDAFPLTASVAMTLRGEGFRFVLAASGVLMVVVLIAYTSLVGFVYKP